MARNENIELTDEQGMRVAQWNLLLAHRVGEMLTLDYEKRDGTRATMVGTMVDLYGSSADHRVIRMETEKGPRSANLYNLISATSAQ